MQEQPILNTAETNTNNIVQKIKTPKPKTQRGRKPKNTAENIKENIKQAIATTDPAAPNTELEIQLQTFHYNFSDELAERFAYFAALHRYEDRKTFKENWEKWIQEEDVANAIAKDRQALESEGYGGDTLDKMFKSVRYYYRKKPTVPKAPQKRKAYVAFPQEILAHIDKHIVEIIVANTNTEHVCNISPAKAFERYITQRQGQSDTPALDESELAKYKKTYKNRFFIASRNIRALSYDDKPSTENVVSSL
jgi:hypothetical protein